MKAARRAAQSGGIAPPDCECRIARLRLRVGYRILDGWDRSEP